MIIATKLLSAAAVLGLAAPAAAQYQYPNPQPYPQPGYPAQTYPYPYPNQGYPQPGYGNPVTDIIDQLLGNRYNVSDRQAIRQCARAAMAQAQSQYGYGGTYGYNQQNGYGGQQYGHNPQYGNRFRVTAITDVERRSNGLRVSGTLDSGRRYGGYGNQGYGNQGYGNQGYGYPGGRAGDLTFRCNVDYRGAVTYVRVRDNSGYRPY